MNLLFFLTPKQDVLFIYEDFTLRQTLEKWSNQRFATIPVLKRNGEYLGTMTEGDILWGIKSIHGLDIDASEDIPIASFPRRRDYKAVPVTTGMHALLNAAVDRILFPWWMTATYLSALYAVPQFCSRLPKTMRAQRAM